MLVTIVGADVVGAVASVLAQIHCDNGEAPMTPEQLRVKLNLMTGEKRRAFLRTCELDPALNDDQIVWKFQQPGGWNERMHYALGERTEEDEKGQASIKAVGSARRGYYGAAIGIVIAVLAVIVALVK